jgi:hypothetical protein
MAEDPFPIAADSTGSKLTCFVILGAAVRPDGTPSGSLRRRVEAAIASAKGIAPRCFLPTGGVGRFGPAEAEVMAAVLRDAGIPVTEIIVEPTGDDTLASVIKCNRLLLKHFADETDGLIGINQQPDLVICTSSYHMLRCRMLFSLLGWRTMRCIPIEDRSALGTVKWLRYWIKDWIATPYDLAIILFRILFRRL